VRNGIRDQFVDRHAENRKCELSIVSQMGGRQSQARNEARSPLSRRGRIALALLASVFLVAALGPSGAGATTGATPLAKPPRWNVTRHQARPYLGRFRLAAPRGRQLISAAYAAEINENGYLEGSLVVYTYDEAGRETSWVGRTYEYHAVGPGRMTVDVIAPANENIFARLHLRALPGGRLTGRLESIRPPLAPVRPQRITLRRVH
jgi:hypothetical protein